MIYDHNILLHLKSRWFRARQLQKILHNNEIICHRIQKKTKEGAKTLAKKWLIICFQLEQLQHFVQTDLSCCT